MPDRETSATAGTPPTASPLAERPAVLELSNVVKSFGGFRALDGIALTVSAGEVHGLVGPNGSGKSTLVKILAGYHEPDPGARIEWPAARRAHGGDNVRFVHQGLGLVLELNAIENIVLGRGYHRRAFGAIDWAHHRRATARAIEALGLSLDVELPVGELTALEQTAVAIARAIEDWEVEGGLLVLDEPTVTLTTKEVGSLFDIIRSVTRRGAGVIFISHRLDEVFGICDRITVLRGGRIVSSLPIAETTHDTVVEQMAGMPLGAADKPAPAGDAAVALELVDVSAPGLAPLSLAIRAGEIVGVAGLVGAGREVLPYVLGGAIRATAGMIRTSRGRVDGVASALAAGISLLPGDRARQAAFAEFDVSENVTISTVRRHRRHGRVRRPAELGRTRAWISALGVSPPDPEAPIWSLSGGNQQKVVMARCLESDPAIVVMDEPTQGVDVGARRAMHDLVRARAREGVAFVLCCSDAAELAEVATRVVVLRADLGAVELAGDEVTEGRILEEMNRTVGLNPHTVEAEGTPAE